MNEINCLIYQALLPKLTPSSAGREYRLRLVLKGDSGDQVVDVKQLMEVLSVYGATVRAHFGSLLILRVPVSPTANLVAIVTHLEQNSARYGFTSLHLTLPDSEEVCTRWVALLCFFVFKSVG